jgi:hypothetical protein
MLLNNVPTYLSLRSTHRALCNMHPTHHTAPVQGNRSTLPRSTSHIEGPSLQYLAHQKGAEILSSLDAKVDCGEARLKQQSQVSKLCYVCQGDPKSLDKNVHKCVLVRAMTYAVS